MLKYLTLTISFVAYQTSIVCAQVEGPVCGCTSMVDVSYFDIFGLIVNGGFELQRLSTSYQIDLAGSSNLTGWTIEGAGIVHTGNYWQAARGNQSVELNYLASGGISQQVAIERGSTYLLEFDLSGEPDIGVPIKQLQIFWGNELVRTVSFDTTGYSRANMGWKHFSFVLPALTADTAILKFFGSTPTTGNGGVAIDNVFLDRRISWPNDPPSVVVIPETSNLCLSAISLLGFAFGIVRTRNRIAHVNS